MGGGHFPLTVTYCVPHAPGWVTSPFLHATYGFLKGGVVECERIDLETVPMLRNTSLTSVHYVNIRL